MAQTVGDEVISNPPFAQLDSGKWTSESRKVIRSAIREFSSFDPYFAKRYQRGELEIVGIKVYATK